MAHRGPTLPTTLHFDLRHSGPTEKYQLHVSGELFDLILHDDESRAQACRENAGLAALSNERLAHVTHFVSDIPLPADLARFVYVTKTVSGLALNELPPIALCAVHVPPDAMLACRRNRHAAGEPRPDPRFAELSIQYPAGAELAFSIAGGLDRYHTPRATAQAIVFQHPQLATRDKDAAAQVMNNHIAHAEGIDGLVSAVSSQGQDGWAVSKPAVDVHGNEFKWGDQWGDRKGQTVYHYDLTKTTVDATAQPASSACTTSQDDLVLQGKKWNVLQGQPNQQTQPAADTSTETALIASGSQKNFILNSLTPGPGVSYDPSSIAFTAGKTPDEAGTFSIDVSNSFLRILWAWVQYVDQGDNVIDSNGNPKPKNYFEQIGLGVITSVNTIIAIPIPTPPTTLTFPWPEKASYVRIALTGLGGSNTPPGMGALMTAPVLLTLLFQYEIPVIFLAAGAALENGSWYKGILKAGLGPLVGSLKSVLESEASSGPSLMSAASVTSAAASGIAGFLVSGAAEEIAAFIALKITAAETIDDIPIVGWISRIASCVITAASLLETTVEIALSPSVYFTEVHRFVVLEVTIHPDPTKGNQFVPPTWPDVASGGHCLFQVQIQGGTNYSLHLDMPQTTSSDPIAGKFPQLPAGGKLQVVFGVYSKDDWLAGQWTSAWIDAVAPADGSALTLEGSIIESLARLTAKTQYTYEESLRWNGSQHAWANDKPTAVKKDLDCDTGLCLPASLTINDKAYMLGYTWQTAHQNLSLCQGETGSGQVFAFQNINIGATPEASLKFPTCGFTAEPALIYDQFGPAPLLTLPLSAVDALDGNTLSADIRNAFSAVDRALPADATITTTTQTAEWTITWPRLTSPAYSLRRSPAGIDVGAFPDPPFSPRNFYVDPRGDHFHLRQVTLDNSTPFDMQPALSWGRFNFPHLDAFAVHPAGYVIGASLPNHRLDIVKLPPQGVRDDEAPLAVTVAGKGLRQGLLNGPTALCIASDGRILVLEKGNLRVQAFDVNGNAAPSFDGPQRAVLSVPAVANKLDSGFVPVELRQALAASGIELNAHWLIPNGTDQFEANGDGAQLVIRRNGAQMSTTWDVSDATHTYHLVETNGAVIVQVPGAADFPLPDDAQSTLDLGSVNADIVAAFKAQGIELALQATVTGNGLSIKREGAEASLALGKVPAELVTALATRGITLSADAVVRDDIHVAVSRAGAEWIVRDDSKAVSYKLTLGEGEKVTVLDYLAFFPLHSPEKRTYLSMSSELKGYIYILSYKGEGNSVDDYVLDIYEPGGSWLSGTNGVNAAQMVVNQWRTVYTLDYQHFAGPGGRVEPSVSSWIPEEGKS
jgi:hypothetical protein